MCHRVYLASRPPPWIIRVALIALAFYVALCWPRGADNPRVRDYEVKAAFLLQFPNFVQWPSAKLRRPADPIVILIAAQGPIGEALEKLARNKFIDAHPVLIRRWTRAEDIQECHLVYVDGSKADQFDQLIPAAGAQGVLLVSDGDNALARRGMIRFYIDSGNVRFEADPAAAKSAGLQISSKLLSIVQRWQAERTR